MSFLTKLWNSLSSSKLHAEIQQEIETHLALLEEEARTRGLDGRDAQMDARQRFGNLGKHFENIRDTNLLPDSTTLPTTYALPCARWAGTADLPASPS
jgi:hypothetical protein